jgi:peroxiredoxin
MPNPDVGDRAPDLTLVNGRGRPRRLSSFWKQKPVVLVFLRHFG